MYMPSLTDTAGHIIKAFDYPVMDHRSALGGYKNDPLWDRGVLWISVA